MSSRYRYVVGGVVAALVLSSCASDGKSTANPTVAGGGGPTTSTTIGKLVDVGNGVTADAIKIGMTGINYDTIKNFIDFDRGDEQKTAQVFIDDINKNGGVLGRKLVPVYKKYLPIGNTDVLKTCTALTEDDGVFAVIGLVYDTTGQGQLCLSKQHNTPHVGFELREAWMNQAPGLMVTPSRSKERDMRLLMKLLDEQKFFETHKKVAILTDQNSDSLVKDGLDPTIKALGLEQGSKAVLTITGEDTTAAQGQLDSFLERWKNEGVDTLIMASETASAKQFVEKIKREIPKLALIGAVDTGLEQAGKDEVAAGKDPNPYEGVYSVAGETATKRFHSAAYQKCLKVYEDATGTKVTAPEDVKPKNGKTDELWVAIDDYCTLLHFFRTVAERVGVTLTAANWKNAVETFGKIGIESDAVASLGNGKYDANDAVRLSRFDSTQSNTGGWKPVTPLVDATTVLSQN